MYKQDDTYQAPARFDIKPGQLLVTTATWHPVFRLVIKADMSNGWLIAYTLPAAIDRYAPRLLFMSVSASFIYQNYKLADDNKQ